MNTTDLTIDDRATRLLREAATWRLLGRLFECPTDAWRVEIGALAAELGDADLAAAVAAADTLATEGQYHSVFGPGGPAPPREASYHDTVELGSLMSELAVYYEAFGYHPQLQDTPDHVAVEAGFVSYLKFKQAYACAEGDEERADVTARACERFVADHLAMLAAPLAGALAGSHLDYLARASRALAARVGPRPSSGRLPMVEVFSPEDEGGEFPCATP